MTSYSIHKAELMFKKDRKARYRDHLLQAILDTK